MKSDLWKELAKWLLGLWAAAMLGFVGWTNARVGNVQDELKNLDRRITRIETMTDNLSKQLDALQPQRFVNAAKDIDVASLEIKKASTIVLEAAQALKRAQEAPPRK